MASPGADSLSILYSIRQWVQLFLLWLYGDVCSMQHGHSQPIKATNHIDWSSNMMGIKKRTCSRTVSWWDRRAPKRSFCRPWTTYRVGNSPLLLLSTSAMFVVVLQRDILSSPGSNEQSEDIATESTINSDVTADDLDVIQSSDLSRTSSESHLQMMTADLANRGPQQSELELR